MRKTVGGKSLQNELILLSLVQAMTRLSRGRVHDDYPKVIQSNHDLKNNFIKYGDKIMSKSQKTLVDKAKKPTSNLTLFILGFLLSSASTSIGKSMATSNAWVIISGAVGTVGAIIMLVAILNGIVGIFKKEK